MKFLKQFNLVENSSNRKIQPTILGKYNTKWKTARGYWFENLSYILFIIIFIISFCEWYDMNVIFWFSVHFLIRFSIYFLPPQKSHIAKGINIRLCIDNSSPVLHSTTYCALFRVLHP